VHAYEIEYERACYADVQDVHAVHAVTKVKWCSPARRLSP
jgi:hypothetical protein